MRKAAKKKKKLPIDYWSHSSLMAFLRNPLAWHKRYVQKIYDTPRSPSAVVGSAGHKALEHFYLQASSGEKPSSKKAYGGFSKEQAIEAGQTYLQGVSDFEINFGAAKTAKAKKAKRAAMERGYRQAVSFYLARPPRHRVVGVEVRGVASVPGLPLPVKAVSDLVVHSKLQEGALDIVDHKFVDSFSKSKADNPLFMMQAIFNYYTVSALYGKPVRRFLVYECKKTKNADGRAQLRRYSIDYRDADEAFAVFHRLLADATNELLNKRTFLPNPSDMFEGENSFDVYRLNLTD
ncbi:PD-(D/E)XK nuclease family protein [Candidatus Parcubacteria bacterium]|nr:PD-(D/E)XK nuclease family protein [Candidatus Parcubacteria bacterium]